MPATAIPSPLPVFRRARVSSAQANKSLKRQVTFFQEKLLRELKHEVQRALGISQTPELGF
jgi:predicted site-specific integrase-resolvase